MEIANLRQPPFSTTLMGCVKGAADHFDAGLSAPMLFGLTGHAFLVNIHRDLCPSSPYVWNTSRFRGLLAGIGIDTVAEYQVSRNDPEPERRRVEGVLKAHLDGGRLCMLDFLEHQLIAGYDESGFLVLLPWNGRVPSEVPRIAFGSWEPCLRTEGWAHVTVLGRNASRKPVEAAVRDALAFALELGTDPAPFQAEGYRIGAGAYENWIAAIERGLGASHGHWWNAVVWAECRGQAAGFFRELTGILKAPVAVRACEELEKVCAEAGRSISAAGERALAPAEQIRLLRLARDADGAGLPVMEALSAAL